MSSIEKKKTINKKIKVNKLNRKNCKIHETKISAYTPAPSPFSTVSKANKRILSMNGHI